jgi:hypothetical protein
MEFKKEELVKFKCPWGDPGLLPNKMTIGVISEIIRDNEIYKIAYFSFAPLGQIRGSVRRDVKIGDIEKLEDSDEGILKDKISNGLFPSSEEMDTKIKFLEWVYDYLPEEYKNLISGNRYGLHISTGEVTHKKSKMGEAGMSTRNKAMIGVGGLVGLGTVATAGNYLMGGKKKRRKTKRKRTKRRRTKRKSNRKKTRKY